LSPPRPRDAPMAPTPVVIQAEKKKGW